MHRRRLLPSLVAGVAMLAACSGAGGADPDADRSASTADPTEDQVEDAVDQPRPPAVEVTGPVAGTPATSGGAGLADAGYVEEELFVHGTAQAFEPDGDLGDDGRWTLRPADRAPFTTRILVKRPAEPAAASGVVVVEWNNVSAGFDAAPDWTFTAAELVRSGHVHVAVSAQKVGVDAEPGGGLVGSLGSSLAASDPARYGGLSHPGDRFSYDLFSQVGALVRVAPAGGPDPLGGIGARHVLAIGESQSAFRLTAYANGVHPLAGVFDGFLIHSRGGGAAPFADEGGIGSAIDGGVRIRDDLDVPVLVLSTETDLTLLGYAAARQDDSGRFRSWEVAGTAHADSFLLGGDPVAAADLLGCAAPVNDGPQHLVLKAALAGLVSWVRDGDAPPRGEPIELAADGTIARDADGNALGGIRLPAVEVPTATLSGDPVGDSVLCRLFGSTRAFSAEELLARYGSREAFLERVDTALDGAVDAGFLLEADRQAARDHAERRFTAP